MIIHGDSLEAMKKMEDQSIDLIMTSPPYADARKHTYGGVPPEEYVEWFIPFSIEMKRLLKPSGSFILNIKEKAVERQRSPYVLKLILTLIEHTGFLWIEEYIWHKSDPYPVNPTSTKRLKDGWERLLHFGISKDYKFRHDHVIHAAKEIQWRKRKLTPKDNSGMIMRKHNIFGRKIAYPSNVIYGATSTAQGHSAIYPEYLPAFFVKLLTDEGDTVLDPFCGSGTTCIVAKDSGRQWIGIDSDPKAVEVARKRTLQENLI